jgi:hypothetical protein
MSLYKTSEFLRANSGCYGFLLNNEVLWNGSYPPVATGETFSPDAFGGVGNPAAPPQSGANMFAFRSSGGV